MPFYGLKRRFCYFFGCSASKAPQRDFFCSTFKGFEAKKDMTGNNMLELVSLSGEKKIKATPMKQDLGTF